MYKCNWTKLNLISDMLRSYCLRVQDMITESTNEIDSYCVENDWLNQIRAYANEWKVEDVLEWIRTNGANEIEDQLIKIRTWIDNIKNGMEKTFVTKNRLIKIDTNPVENALVPRLDKIYADICEFTIKEFFKEAHGFVAEVKKIIKVRM